jgi:hypothetical protein
MDNFNESVYTVVMVKNRPVKPKGASNKEASPNSKLLDFWNKGGAIKCKEITPEIEKLLAARLKDYTKEEIAKSIKNYFEVLADDSYFFDRSWSLVTFLKQKNCLPLFMNDGEQWINFTKQKNTTGAARVELASKYTKK